MNDFCHSPSALPKAGLVCASTTAIEIADYFRLKPAEQVKAAFTALLADERILKVEVEDWAKPAYTTEAALNEPLTGTLTTMLGAPGRYLGRCRATMRAYGS